jgi:transposase
MGAAANYQHHQPGNIHIEHSQHDMRDGRVHDWCTDSGSSVESTFDLRLRELRELLEELRSAELTPSSQATESFHEAVQILCQNADMIRWKMRVAKHCSRSVRDVIWRNVRNSIAELEKRTDQLEQEVREYIPLPSRPFSSNGETLPF